MTSLYVDTEEESYIEPEDFLQDVVDFCYGKLTEDDMYGEVSYDVESIGRYVVEYLKNNLIIPS